jgi:hypothetical protein
LAVVEADHKADLLSETLIQEGQVAVVEDFKQVLQEQQDKVMLAAAV